MTGLLDGAKEKFDQVLVQVKHDISALRTGRAHSALVEDMMIDAYDQRQPLKNLASITIPDSRTIMIQPWDKSITQAIEKSIRDAGVGLNPVGESSTVRVSIPALTEETRRDIVKVLHQKLEQGKIQVRNVREDIKNQIIAAEKAKEITEDDRYSQQEKLEKLVKDANEAIKKVGEEKESEIMKI
jgi:ribosome recycling factor